MPRPHKAAVQVAAACRPLAKLGQEPRFLPDKWHNIRVRVVILPFARLGAPTYGRQRCVGGSPLLAYAGLLTSRGRPASPRVMVPLASAGTVCLQAVTARGGSVRGVSSP